MRRTALSVAALATLALTACKQDQAATAPREAPKPAAAPAQEMPDWKAAFSHEVGFDPTGKMVTVTVKVAPGFHAYTVGETTGKPMQLTIAEDSEFALEGDVKYPAGVAKDLPVGRSVIVEGTAEISAQVAPKSEAAKTVKGAFRYQVCTDEACDRPRTAPFSLPSS
ncbi:MAG: hypothetical protein H6730_19370 [Deltaproteobacteria bacterium]|nr:hypothetical protein [Deltaproteobacteria bacterium]